jgi:hypothetical protein
MLYRWVLGHYSTSTFQEGAIMKLSSAILTIAVLAAATTTSADAQGRGRGKGNQGVPPGQRPPAGMCRIWIDGVPPGHQPAPTDCETAVRNQPRNSQVIWGDNTNNRAVSNDNRGGRRERGDNNPSVYRRDSHGHTYDPTCVDNDRNGWCDYHPEMRSGVHAGDVPGNNGGSGGGTNVPGDRGSYPSTMPAMTGAVLIRVGVRTVDVQNWLGRTDVRSETVDANGDGVPEQATWYDTNGTILQVWRDDDRDGRADQVEIFRNGQSVQVIR